MSILVKGCFNWIGFHIVDHLLKEGYEVKGIQTTSSKQSTHLSYFFDRHTGFSLIDDKESQHVQTALLVNESGSDVINASRTIVVSEQPDLENMKDHQIVIKQPLLFGEWMPIQDNGCYYLNEYIPFDSVKFREQAIWIHDFTKKIVTLLAKKALPQIINVERNQNGAFSGLTLDNTFHIQDNTPIDSKVEDVLDHYKRFNQYYE